MCLIDFGLFQTPPGWPYFVFCPLLVQISPFLPKNGAIISKMERNKAVRVTARRLKFGKNDLIRSCLGSKPIFRLLGPFLPNKSPKKHFRGSHILAILSEF